MNVFANIYPDHLLQVTVCDDFLTLLSFVRWTSIVKLVQPRPDDANNGFRLSRLKGFSACPFNMLPAREHNQYEENY